MAALRKATGKTEIDDELLDTDSDFSDEDDDRLAQLRKGNEDTYNIDQRVMVRYGTNVDQKKSLTNYYIKFLGLLVVLILIPAEIVLRNRIFETELLAIQNYQRIIDDLGPGARNFFTWFCIIFTWSGRYLFVK